MIHESIGYRRLNASISQQLTAIVGIFLLDIMKKYQTEVENPLRLCFCSARSKLFGNCLKFLDPNIKSYTHIICHDSISPVKINYERYGNCGFNNVKFQNS